MSDFTANVFGTEMMTSRRNATAEGCLFGSCCSPTTAAIDQPVHTQLCTDESRVRRECISQEEDENRKEQGYEIERVSKDRRVVVVACMQAGAGA